LSAFIEVARNVSGRGRVGR